MIPIQILGYFISSDESKKTENASRIVQAKKEFPENGYQINISPSRQEGEPWSAILNPF